MSTTRLTIRLPRELAERLATTASNAGFSSACGLARSVLVQFLRSRDAIAQETTRHTGWMADFIDADRDDPVERKRINERL